MEESGGGAAAAAEELVAFLRAEGRPELRARALRAVLGLTGGAEGRRLLAGRAEAAAALLALAGGPCAALAGDALRALVNLASELAARGALRPALPALLRRALPPARGDGDAAEEAPLAAAALANLSRDPAAAGELWRELRHQAGGLEPLVEALCRPEGPDAADALAPLLANLSQLPQARAALLDPARGLLQRLLPLLTQAAGSSHGVVGTLRNCCFDHGHHAWLLSDQVDVLPFLLLPLAGPEEFPEDEMEKLPLDLQYLPPEKQREPDPEIRKMLLEAILLLTATKPGRQAVRERGTYFILRELHKWETDPGALVACEKLIQVLIGDEPEPGMENLLEVEIPAEVEEQLQHLDREEEQREQPAPGSQSPRG